MKFVLFLFFALCWYSAMADEDYTDNENKGVTNWAVLIAGSNGWENYRHQSDVCHAYHVLINRGIKPEHIIVMMYDDIANNTHNPYRGKIFNEPNGTDVYKNIQIDYSGDDITPQTFLNVLKGNKTGNKGKGNEKVLNSKADDNVFVYFSGHGNVHIMAVLKAGLHKSELFDAFKYMHKNKMYKKMLFYLESCESGSMFVDLEPNWNIYAVTASNETYPSSGVFCDGDISGCYGDEFSINWMKDTEKHDINFETVGNQFNNVWKATQQSTVCEYGNFQFRADEVAFYQGNEIENDTKYFDDEELFFNEEEKDSMPSSEVNLFAALKMAEKQGMSKSGVSDLAKIYAKKREQITIFVETAIKCVIKDDKKVERILSGGILSRYTELQCHANVMKAFTRCVPLGSNIYALKFSSTFANLCEIVKSDEAIIVYFNKKCINGPLFEGVI